MSELIRPGDRPVRLAVINSKGGTGKTRTAVSLATYWAWRMGEVHLIDVDPQDTGSATTWLDRTSDDLVTLFWARATADELVNAIGGISRPVIMDTRPYITAADVQIVAELADLILIPGSTDEVDSIVETHRRIAASTPRVVVITRTPTATLDASTGAASIAALEQIGLPVVGAIRWNQPLARGSIEKRRPDQLTPSARHRLRQDVEQIVKELRNHVELPAEVQTVA